MVHGCMVYPERAETAAVLCGTSHVAITSLEVHNFDGLFLKAL